MAGQGKLLVLFRYERLLDFCYIYGKLDHWEQDCDKVVTIKKEGKKLNREYGSWLRAEGPTFIIKEVEQGCRSKDSSSSHSRRYIQGEPMPKTSE